MLMTDENNIIGLIDCGLSVIPITEGAKNPHRILGAKHDLLDRRATREEVERWLAAGVRSWGVAGGAVSGNLVCLDFDEKHYEGLYDLWRTRLSDDQKVVVATCMLSKTRNNGKHLRYRTTTPQPTEKLARRVEFNKETQKEEIVTTAETRGEGAYALIPPSAGYEFIHGDLMHIPVVTDEMHESLIDILRTFDEVEDEPATEYEWKPNDTTPGDRPGDRFNALATWEEILKPHGWLEEYKDHWRRPGKKDGEGISATTNWEGRPMLYVFSTAAAPFSENKGYSKFHAFALLKHGGDFKTAARAAAEMYPQTTHQETAAGGGSHAAFTPLRDLLNEPPEEIDWIVDGLLPSGGLSILVAKPKVGKSTLARQLALSVARGEPFLGRDTAKGPVLYVSLEEKRSEVQKHFQLLGADKTEDLGVYVGPVPQGAHAWLTAEIEKVRPVLVIIDTLIRFINVSQINDYAEVTKALDPLLNLARKHNAHLMCLHHARKMGGEGADVTLGSSGIFGTVDTAIILNRTDSRRTIETQQRYGQDLESTVLIFDADSRCVALGGTKEEDDIRTMGESISKFLDGQQEPVSEGTIKDGVKGRGELKVRALRKLLADGEISRTGGGKKGDPYLYSRSFVPAIYGEPEKPETKSTESIDSIRPDSGSQDSSGFDVEIDTLFGVPSDKGPWTPGS